MPKNSKPNKKLQSTVPPTTEVQVHTPTQPTEAGPHTLLHTLDDKGKVNSPMAKKNSTTKVKPVNMFLGALVIVSAGTITGFGLSKTVGANTSSTKSTEVTGIEAGTGKIADGQVSKGDVLGSPEKNGDEAEGVLEKGGINGEGSHRLLRPGGPSQTVYLTSSVVDLDQLVGHKVKVWGETFSAQSAGWLMDVVTLEIVELDAPKPFEED